MKKIRTFFFLCLFFTFLYDQKTTIRMHMEKNQDIWDEKVPNHLENRYKTWQKKCVSHPSEDRFAFLLRLKFALFSKFWKGIREGWKKSTFFKQASVCSDFIPCSGTEFTFSTFFSLSNDWVSLLGKKWVLMSTNRA